MQMRAASHFGLLGSGGVELRARIRNDDFSVHIGRKASSATPLERIYTNLLGRIVNRTLR